MTLHIIWLIVTLLASAFFSGMEIAFVSSNRLLAEMDKEKNGLSQKAISIFYQHPNNFVSTMLVGNNIALVIYAVLCPERRHARHLRYAAFYDYCALYGRVYAQIHL